MYKRYIVTLTASEREDLKQLIAAGQGSARKLMHARILLKADQGPLGPGWTDAAIAEALAVSRPTVERVRKQFIKEGLAAARQRRRPRREYERRLDGAGEARLITLACSATPAGHGRWTLGLLAERMVALEVVDTLSSETVRRVLKKTHSSHG